MYFISKLMFFSHEKYYGCRIFFHRTHMISLNTVTFLSFQFLEFVARNWTLMADILNICSRNESYFCLVLLSVIHVL